MVTTPATTAKRASILDLLAKGVEEKLPAAVRAAEDQAMGFETSLTRDLRRYLLEALLEVAEEEADVPNDLENLSHAACNRFLREFPLTYLLEHESERILALEQFLDAARSGLQARIPTRTLRAPSRAVSISLDDKFVAAAERYMNRLDKHAAKLQT